MRCWKSAWFKVKLSRHGDFMKEQTQDWRGTVILIVFIIAIVVAIYALIIHRPHNSGSASGKNPFQWLSSHVAGEKSGGGAGVEDESVLDRKKMPAKSKSILNSEESKGRSKAELSRNPIGKPHPGMPVVRSSGERPVLQ